MLDLSNLVPLNSGQVDNFFLLVLGQVQMGMFKNNEAFHFMASYAHVCLDFKDQT